MAEKKEHESIYRFTRVSKVARTPDELLAEVERQMGGQLTENTLSAEQRDVLHQICKWHELGGELLTLGGYAGVGKSTLISVLAGHLRNEDVAFCAFTGKATQVLRRKFREANVPVGKRDIQTIHALMYEPIVDKKTGSVIEWEKKTSLDKELIVVDEASMLDKTLFDDLSSYGIPMLAVGDHGQLPPVSGNFNLMEKPMLRLETIHRQAEGSPILALSAFVRRTGQVPRTHFCDDSLAIQVLPPDALTDVVFSLFSGKGVRYDDVGLLAYTNAERIELNDLARTARWGRDIDVRPLVGDQLICLRNAENSIFNGMRGTLLSLDTGYETKNHYWGKVLFEDDEIMVEGPICKAQFGREGTIKDFDEYFRLTGQRVRSWQAMGLLMDWGYALTVHKAQGSSFDHVVLVNEPPRHMSLDMKKRAVYTAVTRAARYLAVLQP